MNKIFYTFTNKSKFLFYLMILVLCLLRLALMIEIKIFQLEGYQVFLLPTIVYYFVLFALITGLFFGYKFFFAEYDDHKISYRNLLLNRSRTISFDSVKKIRFGKKGIHFYDCAAPSRDSRPLLFIPFFRLGIVDAISVNDFFETVLDRGTISVEKTFKVLPGYSKPWTLLSLFYAFLSFCMLIICAEPLYTVIVLFQVCR